MFLDSIQWFVLTILALLVIIIFWWSIYAFFFAIFQFVFSSWDTEKIKKAWNSIRFMILWIFMTLIFLFAFPIIFKRLNVPGYEAYTANNIFDKSTEIISALFLFGTDAAENYQPWGWVITNPWSISNSTKNWNASKPIPAPADRQLEL